MIQQRCDVANVEQVLRNLLQDETVEVSERSRSNYCKIRKCWDVTALVLVTRLIVCRRQTDRQTDWRVREQTRLSLGGSHFCQESRMPNQIQIGSRHDGPLFASVRRSDMVQVPLAQMRGRTDITYNA